jgi:hypothetical protein
LLDFFRVASLNNPSTIPLEIATIVSLKITFDVVFNHRSFGVWEKTLHIKSIITSPGTSHSLPQTQKKYWYAVSIHSNEKTTLPKTLHSPSIAMSRLSTRDSPNVRYFESI